ncbi:MAG: hypothetical protein RBS43_08845 [Candidatus Cloacimonas sp.]|jgi:hypothetical protein|nr:hypothetical protein [Candidatus Cloacimonas sp.]
MEKVKIMPRHLLLLAMPILAAVLGGMLTSGNLSAFIAAYGGRGISQAQLYLAISFLTGAIAFSWRCLPKSFTYGLMVFVPLIYGLLVLPQLGAKVSLSLLYGLNLAFTLGIWLALKITFFSKAMLRIRTAGFAALAAGLLSVYFRLLFMLLKLPFMKESWSGYFWNSLFLFIFIGFGLSLADIVIIRKDVTQYRLEQRKRDFEDEDDDDN